MKNFILSLIILFPIKLYALDIGCPNPELLVEYSDKIKVSYTAAKNNYFVKIFVPNKLKNQPLSSIQIAMSPDEGGFIFSLQWEVKSENSVATFFASKEIIDRSILSILYGNECPLFYMEKLLKAT